MLANAYCAAQVAAPLKPFPRRTGLHTVMAARPQRAEVYCQCRLPNRDRRISRKFFFAPVLMFVEASGDGPRARGAATIIRVRDVLSFSLWEALATAYCATQVAASLRRLPVRAAVHTELRQVAERFTRSPIRAAEADGAQGTKVDR